MQKNLTAKEYELLRENLEFYDSLDSGERTPTSNSQKQFVSVCKGLEEAKTEHEIAYIKYKKAGLIRSDLRSEEIIFKKISAKNKKYVIAPERNNISAQKTRKPVKPATNPKEIAKRNQELFRETGYLAEESQGGGGSKQYPTLKNPFRPLTTYGKKIILNKNSSEHCPRCEEKGRGIFPLVQRQRKRSDPLWDLSTNRSFIGCSNYPNCRYVISPDSNNTLSGKWLRKKQ